MLSWCSFLSISDRMFEAKPTPDQEQIAEHEHLLKTLPQIQMVSDSNVSNGHDYWLSFDYLGAL